MTWKRRRPRHSGSLFLLVTASQFCVAPAGQTKLRSGGLLLSGRSITTMFFLSSAGLHGLQTPPWTMESHGARLLSRWGLRTRQYGCGARCSMACRVIIWAHRRYCKSNYKTHHQRFPQCFSSEIFIHNEQHKNGQA